MDELWDIYDREKKPTGRTMRRGEPCRGEGEYHLHVLGVLVRPDGRFLITRRSADKEWAPGWWEVPGGAVLAGEDSADAIRREVREETGLHLEGAQGGLLFTYRRDGADDHYFVDVYRYCLEFSEEEIRLQKEEVMDHMLAGREQIAELGEQGIFLHYNSIREAFAEDGKTA